MPGPDPTHWLLRLTAVEWLQAADHELGLAEQALGRRAARPGLTYARRAAGMAWNAVLVGKPDPGAGRSYMEHLVALGKDAGVPDEVRRAALRLTAAAGKPPELVRLGGPDLEPARAARVVLEHARGRVGGVQPDRDIPDRGEPR